jgi:Ca2+-dependent lipid-binding protein
MGPRGSVGDSDALPPSVRSHLVNAIVEVTIDSAKGLPSVGLLSTINAFVRVRTGGVREPFETCVVNNDNNPVWQQT